VGGTCSTNGEKRNVYRLLVGKSEGKRPLGRPRCRWIDSIKIDLLKTGLSVVDWIGLAQDRYTWRALVNSEMNLRVPSSAGNLPNGCTTGGLLSGTQLHRVSSLVHQHVVCTKRDRNLFLKPSLISLQCNKIRVPPDTPLHCLHAAINVLLNSGSCFAG
jgi:hypothetical protein